MGVRRCAAGGRVARNGAARASARDCREDAEVAGQVARGNAASDRAATNCRAREPRSAQAPLTFKFLDSRHGQIRPMVVDRGMLRRIYDWCVAAADKPYALWVLAAVSFAESSFFPVPPDVMLAPMALAQPKRAWLFAGVCTVASVVGGMLGYAIGA